MRNNCLLCQLNPYFYEKIAVVNELYERPIDPINNPVQKSAEKLIAIACSAGGLEALEVILPSLPEDFPAAIAVVRHLSSEHPSYLAQILDRQTGLKVLEASIGMNLYPSTVYVAPPDHHLLIEGKSITLSQAQKAHHVRPSAEYLFYSAAHSYKDKLIAVVLTGGDHDGMYGVQIVRENGGIVVAQDEKTSKVFGMPSAAIDTGCVDFIMPLHNIANTLINLIK